MNTSKTLGVVMIVCALVGFAPAAPLGGCWSSADGDFDAGTWQEVFYGGGEGQPGNEISASNASWSLEGAVLDTHEWISQTETVHMHKTVYVGGMLYLNAGGPWENTGDTLPYVIALGDLVVYTTKTFENEQLTQLSWTIEAEGTLQGCDSYKVSISASYAGLPTPIDVEGYPAMTDDIDDAVICVSIAADIDVDPDTLNLHSRGRWITVYVDLGDCIDLEEVDGQSLLLNDTLMPAWYAIQCDDDDDDDSMDMDADDDNKVLMLKFDRSEVQEIVEPGMVEMTLTGMLTDGTEFFGSDTIRVIDRPKMKPENASKKKK